MARDTDPVGNGFVATLSRPGGNITGLSSLASEISGKHMELLKEIVPRLSRLAVLGTSTTPGNTQILKEIEIAAGAFGVMPKFLDVLTAKDIEPAFRTSSQGACRCNPGAGERYLGFSSKTGCRPYGKEPASGDIP
jgi:putative ABC transport system substrate-binding protein